MSIRDGVKQLGTLLTNGSKPKAVIDAAAIRELAELLTETGLTEIEVEQGGMRLRVTRQGAPLVYTRANGRPHRLGRCNSRLQRRPRR